MIGCKSGEEVCAAPSRRERRASFRHEPSLLLWLGWIVLEYFLNALLGLFLIARFGVGWVFDSRLAAIHKLLQFRVRHIQRKNQNLPRMLGGKGRRVVGPWTPASPAPVPSPAPAPRTRPHIKTIRGGSGIYHFLSLNVVGNDHIGCLSRPRKSQTFALQFGNYVRLYPRPVKWHAGIFWILPGECLVTGKGRAHLPVHFYGLRAKRQSAQQESHQQSSSKRFHFFAPGG